MCFHYGGIESPFGEGEGATCRALRGGGEGVLSFVCE